MMIRPAPGPRCGSCPALRLRRRACRSHRRQWRSDSARWYRPGAGWPHTHGGARGAIRARDGDVLRGRRATAGDFARARRAPRWHPPRRSDRSTRRFRPGRCGWSRPEGPRPARRRLYSGRCLAAGQTHGRVRPRPRETLLRRLRQTRARSACRNGLRSGRPCRRRDGRGVRRPGGQSWSCLCP